MNPALQVVLYFRLGLERGESLLSLLVQYSSDQRRPLAKELQEWHARFDQGRHIVFIPPGLATPSRRAFLDLLARGLRGESILPALQALEGEVFAQCIEHLEERAALLPFLMLPPLLFLQFPALMLLVLLPLLDSLSGAF